VRRQGSHIFQTIGSQMAVSTSPVHCFPWSFSFSIFGHSKAIMTTNFRLVRDVRASEPTAYGIYLSCSDYQHEVSNHDYAAGGSIYFIEFSSFSYRRSCLRLRDIEIVTSENEQVSQCPSWLTRRRL
jgi:hypothetical protein